MPFVAGCASLETFQDMTASERADYVCVRDEDYADTERELSRVNNIIAETNQALLLGVRFFKQCKTVVDESLSETTSCTPNYAGGVNCTTTRESGKLRQECTDIPIPINADLEERKLGVHLERRDYLDNVITQVYGECYDFVLPMTAEEAFALYKGN